MNNGSKPYRFDAKGARADQKFLDKVKTMTLEELLDAMQVHVRDKRFPTWKLIALRRAIEKECKNVKVNEDSSSSGEET